LANRKASRLLRGAALTYEPNCAIGAARDGDLDAESRCLDLDLEAADLLAERGDILIERANLLARPGTLQRGGTARSPGLPLAGHILLAHALNDLTPFLHPVQQFRLQVHEPAAEMRKLVNRNELLRAVRQEISIVDD
jgi:hypothetical protein